MKRGRAGTVLVATIVAASCSGGGDGDSSATTLPSDDSGVVSVETTVVDQNEAAPTTVADQTPPTTEPPPPTTEPPPPPEPYRAGVLWNEPVEVLSGRSGVERARFAAFDLGDELWVVTSRWNGSVAARSLDGGQSWAEVTIAPPPESGRLHIEHVARGTDGRYVAIAHRQSSCGNGVPAEDGFMTYYACTSGRPAVFVSDDGETWAESSPAGLAPPGDASLHINDLIVVGDTYVAAGTIEGPGWRAVIFSSPDGLAWTAEREFVGVGNPMSARTLAYDGTNLVFTADETPCDGLQFNTGGWDLGAGFARHGRIFIGSDIASLVLQQPGDHPLAPEPLEPPADCGSIDGIPFDFYPYPSFQAEVIDGKLTIFERHVPPEQTAQVEAAQDAGDDELAEELQSTLGTRRWAQLIDGEWVVADVVGVNVISAQAGRLSNVTAVEGRPGFIEVRRIDGPLHDVFIVTEDEPAQIQSAAPLPLSTPLGATGVPDGVLLFVLQAPDPFASSLGDTLSIAAWRSTSGEGPPIDACDIQPGGYCMFGDLRDHPDYPDFSGRDLSGINLTGSEIGSAVFDDANLSGATLRLVTSDLRLPPSFVGADLTGAKLQRAELGDISGATVDGATLADAMVMRADGVDFSDAVLYDAWIEDLTGVTFGDTDLTGARLRLWSADDMPDLASLTYDQIEIGVQYVADTQLEIDLSGFDLTNVSFRGPIASDNLTVITSLDGAVLANTQFGEVDLSLIDPEIDLSEVTVNDATICPDGAPAEDRTCVRE